MKTVGIIGGRAPAVEYYQAIIASCRERAGDDRYPSIVINSIDPARMLGLIAAGDLAGVTEYLGGEIGKLARAGADFGLLAGNTPHVVFDALQRASPIPLVSIVEAACEATAARGWTRVGLFGTCFTMQGRFYPDVFASQGITIIAPDQDDQDIIHDRYMGAFVAGALREETRRRLRDIAERLRESAGIQGIILGGTGLPPLLPDAGGGGLPCLDTMRSHVESVVARLFPEAESPRPGTKRNTRPARRRSVGLPRSRTGRTG